MARLPVGVFTSTTDAPRFAYLWSNESICTVACLDKVVPAQLRRTVILTLFGFALFQRCRRMQGKLQHDREQRARQNSSNVCARRAVILQLTWRGMDLGRHGLPPPNCGKKSIRY